MKVLVIADIHANWAALSAIREDFDVCLCLGDLVDYGPNPKPCIDWVRKNCAHVVRGNHDHGVAQLVPAFGDSGFRYLSAVTRPLMIERLGVEDRRWLGRLPVTRYLRIDAYRILMVHATPRDPLDEYLFQDKQAWQRRVEHLEVDLVCVGHTHHQFAMDVGSAIVLNPGSVGQPRDGDARAAYAIIQDGKIELRRIDYPVEETIQEIQALPIPDKAKLLSTSIFRSGRWAPENYVTGNGNGTTGLRTHSLSSAAVPALSPRTT